MKQLIIKLALLSSVLFPLEALASGTRRISSSDAQGLNGKTLQLSIYPGYDLTIDFLELDQIIVDATLGDPSSFVFNGLVGNLCPKFAKSFRGLMESLKYKLSLKMLNVITGTRFSIYKFTKLINLF